MALERPKLISSGKFFSTGPLISVPSVYIKGALIRKSSIKPFTTETLLDRWTLIGEISKTNGRKGTGLNPLLKIMRRTLCLSPLHIINASQFLRRLGALDKFQKKLRAPHQKAYLAAEQPGFFDSRVKKHGKDGIYALYEDIRCVPQAIATSAPEASSSIAPTATTTAAAADNRRSRQMPLP
jgi:hypothetical protein